MLAPKPLVLFIDAYDSFSNNIISLIETTLDVSVRTVKIDDYQLKTDSELHKELQHYVAVVCGPGPGHPEKEEDIGIVRKIWKLNEDHVLPVLGICLGFQSLCLEFGGKINRLAGPQHGMIRDITHSGERPVKSSRSIFSGVGHLSATLYQSLCADIGQDRISESDWETSKWKATEDCPEIIPIAWAESDLRKSSDSGVKDARVLVGVQHKTKPFWALQYHPESICTNDESKRVIKNWFEAVKDWNRDRDRDSAEIVEPLHGKALTRKSLLHQSEQFRPTLNGSATFPYGEHFNSAAEDATLDGSCKLEYFSEIFRHDKNISVAAVVEATQHDLSSRIVLESSNAYEQSVGAADVRGRYSIIAMDVDQCVRFEYIAWSHIMAAFHPTEDGETTHETDLRQFGGVWPFLAQYTEKRRVTKGNSDSPFWGGFMGFTTYELGLETIGVESRSRQRSHDQPDLSFAWVTRSLVVDHVLNVIHIQEIAPHGATQSSKAWMKETARILRIALQKPEPAIRDESGTKHDTTFKVPAASSYESKVLKCQEYIRSGNSYELCLTDQTTVTTHWRPMNSSWNLYKALRKRQPAPFASYIRLGTGELISSSPERFLKWDAEGHCELRPMKGTVRKSEEVDTLEKAKELLDVPKEKAENLMIVDLVRHDLHGVCGSGNVTVPRLMVVEEYKSVFQMITVVQGSIPQPVTHKIEDEILAETAAMERKTRYTGLDVLAASLPPGSMTGAPKKRSCEILQDIEKGKERSLYSGVVGYLDVGGRGDWSVTIRSWFKWDDDIYYDEKHDCAMDVWKVGAGGAVTTLSTPEGEREEMLTKLNGTLGLLQGTKK
ncbi:ADC synthase [Glarea lozoyensis ATCC 20868]|uniref:aminodeoxychorismate synthase n=1 Tax=Glarea lozoyensis (strain ATCC 20868 / MF5171) TaxID=1116229 RepID=S3DCW9_GLAL2|nr:ADC synthase [Glarea lozoyensis ATCC 20868]EPE29821.1 ADC synthase [Glarea lozoyensis ATCC 20868]